MLLGQTNGWTITLIITVAGPKCESLIAKGGPRCPGPQKGADSGPGGPVVAGLLQGWACSCEISTPMKERGPNGVVKAVDFTPLQRRPDQSLSSNFIIHGYQLTVGADFPTYSQHICTPQIVLQMPGPTGGSGP